MWNSITWFLFEEVTSIIVIIFKTWGCSQIYGIAMFKILFSMSNFRQPCHYLEPGRSHLNAVFFPFNTDSYVPKPQVVGNLSPRIKWKLMAQYYNFHDAISYLFQQFLSFRHLKFYIEKFIASCTSQFNQKSNFPSKTAW